MGSVWLGFAQRSSAPSSTSKNSPLASSTPSLDVAWQARQPQEASPATSSFPRGSGSNSPTIDNSGPRIGSFSRGSIRRRMGREECPGRSNSPFASRKSGSFRSTGRNPIAPSSTERKPSASLSTHSNTSARVPGKPPAGLPFEQREQPQPLIRRPWQQCRSEPPGSPPHRWSPPNGGSAGSWRCAHRCCRRRPHPPEIPG